MNPSMVRRVYDAVGLFAILNLIGLAVLVAYVAGSGVVDTEKLRRIAGVLRGEDPAPEQDQSLMQPHETGTDRAEPTESVRGADAVAEAQMDLEIWRRESERIKSELDQRLALNNSILLRVVAERERFRQELEEAKRKQTTTQQQQDDEGFKKQIAIYESLSPKIAVQHLLAIPDSDEAARILLEVNTRKARGMIEAAKRGDQLQKMKVILQKVREAAPERSELLEAEGR